ncbi:nodulin-related protein 1-like [Andrographis paniculata]|uniref:nodulin-related protein 1-like n=1 Tax=Andrographis paniculata TaxID=175694 RepID=UPI0021E7515A|nr:nodulin-related protein 1-like [Andrographis paniculata]
MPLSAQTNLSIQFNSPSIMDARATTTTTTTAEPQPSKSDLILHSAEVLADAAQCQLRREPDKYDKDEVARATDDLLKAAAEYGKLDGNKGMAKYVDKAEDYLRRCKTPHSA